MKLIDTRKRFVTDDERLNCIEAIPLAEWRVLRSLRREMSRKITREKTGKNKGACICLCLGKEFGKQLGATSGTIFKATHFFL